MTASNARPIALMSASRVRASALRTSPLDLREGLLYGVEVRRVADKYTTSHPVSSTISLTLAPLWPERLSSTTIRPGLRLGASTRSTYASKTSRVVGPSTARHALNPSRVMLASRVKFLPQFFGVLPKARSPLCDQA